MTSHMGFYIANIQNVPKVQWLLIKWLRTSHEVLLGVKEGSFKGCISRVPHPQIPSKDQFLGSFEFHQGQSSLFREFSRMHVWILCIYVHLQGRTFSTYSQQEQTLITQLSMGHTSLNCGLRLIEKHQSGACFTVGRHAFGMKKNWGFSWTFKMWVDWLAC